MGGTRRVASEPPLHARSTLPSFRRATEPLSPPRQRCAESDALTPHTALDLPRVVRTCSSVFPFPASAETPARISNIPPHVQCQRKKLLGSFDPNSCDQLLLIVKQI